MERRHFLRSGCIGAVSAALVPKLGFAAGSARKKNILFIIGDDLNDNIQGFGGHPQAYTPNLIRLAKLGVTFTNAHVNCPLCAPSRPSYLSGTLPTSNAMYHSKPDNFRERKTLQNAVLLPTHLKSNGYQAYVTGKVFHGGSEDNTVFGAPSPKSFNCGFTGHGYSFGPYPWTGDTGMWPGAVRDTNFPSGVQTKEFTFGKLSQRRTAPWNKWFYGDKTYRGFGEFKYNGENDRDRLPDELCAQWVINLLKGREASSFDDNERLHTATPLGSGPWAIFCGFCKTHAPIYIPDYFFDEVLRANGLDDSNGITLFNLPPGVSSIGANNDLNDIPARLKTPVNTGRSYYNSMYAAGASWPGGVEKLFKDAVHAYLAAAYEIDVQVGKILDALEETGALDDTVIIFTSDNGYNWGEKQWWWKYNMWSESTRVPLVIADPDFAASRDTYCHHPVSLVDLYPTLADLNGLPLPPTPGATPPLDGHSMRPFLENPATNDWDGPPICLSAMRGGSMNVEAQDIHPDQAIIAGKSRYWKYIVSWNNGSIQEELYDTHDDPWEFHNLANEARYKEVKQFFDYHISRIAVYNGQHRAQFYSGYNPASFNPDDLLNVVPTIQRRVGKTPEEAYGTRPANLELYSAKGQKVGSLSETRRREARDLPPGIYYSKPSSAHPSKKFLRAR